jgi:gamma-carbonic anhydrase
MSDLSAQLNQQLEKHLRQPPVVGRNVYIARGAIVLGDVTLEDHASVWYGAVLRGDINRIAVGHHTNIQDLAVVHLADEFPCLIGDWVTVGHSAIIHACTVGHETLVGMGACILDGAVIGNQCLIGAKALVPPGMKVPDGSVVLGTPGKIVRQLEEAERAQLKHWAEKYVHNAAYCLRHQINIGAPFSPST